MCDIPSPASDHLCQIGKESILNCTCCTANTARCAEFKQFYCRVMAEWPERYRPRSKVNMPDTLSCVRVWGTHHLIIMAISISHLEVRNCHNYTGDGIIQSGWLNHAAPPLILGFTMVTASLGALLIPAAGSWLSQLIPLHSRDYYYNHGPPQIQPTQHLQ